MSKLLMSSILALGLSMTPALMAQGSSTVREAQQALKDKGFNPGPIDGLNGSRLPETAEFDCKWPSGE
jgi:peptidoglycan hydrolase-like protein with peptidoglycan-binding domain